VQQAARRYTATATQGPTRPNLGESPASAAAQVDSQNRFPKQLKPLQMPARLQDPAEPPPTAPPRARTPAFLHGNKSDIEHSVRNQTLILQAKRLGTSVRWTGEEEIRFLEHLRPADGFKANAQGPIRRVQHFHIRSSQKPGRRVAFSVRGHQRCLGPEGYPGAHSVAGIEVKVTLQTDATARL
jgi:hypothetical protein